MAVVTALKTLQVLTLKDEAATRALAACLADLVLPGDVVALRGDLGAGKTVFARAFINALPDSEGRDIDEDVPSPTFTLLQTYERRPAPVWHFDLYRIESPEEVYELGLEEAFHDGVTLIEWPERMEPLLPADRLDVVLAFSDEETVRRATLRGGEGWRDRLAGKDFDADA